MEQTSQPQLQNKAGAMVACLELVKFNIKADTEFGRMAQGENKLEKWKSNLHKFVLIPANYAFWIFIFYIILF
jgi:hypothetical protein